MFDWMNIPEDEEVDEWEERVAHAWATQSQEIREEYNENMRLDR